MKIIVCGGRDFKDWEFIHGYLDILHEKTPITLLIHGNANGADKMGYGWAWSRKIPYLTVPADWDKNGKGAGPIRNQKMLDEKPDLVIAFEGGIGTKHMIGISKKAGIKVLQP